MRNASWLLASALLVAAPVPAALAASPAAGPTAPLLDGMGPLHHPIQTDSPLAQRYFDQGLTLAWGFNHAGAQRSFLEAARLDPECAMCYWGAALVLGPHVNAGMDPAVVPEAWRLLQQARSLADSVTPRHQAYIEALAARYKPEPVDDRSSLDQAYAEAMGEVAARFPHDQDAAVLYAEALMDTTPWDYWQEDGSPKPVTETVLTTLESVLAANPWHLGANHLYIHIVEAEEPRRGVAAADRLVDLVPAAGHLVHMPSHIYVRVGRYHDATMANVRAVAADEAYITACHEQGVYTIGYVPHNHHFLWFTAAMEGDAERAIEAAWAVRAHTATELMDEPGLGTLQHYWATPLYALTRFGRWEEILRQPPPDSGLLYPMGVWHYARAEALLNSGALSAAEAELAQLREIAANPRLEEVTIWDINTTADLLAIAVEVTAGDLAAARGELESAVEHMRRAVELEDALNYDEPPPWHAPTRQSLGAVLLQAGQPQAAEKAFREDLEVYPDNGWSLRGLAAALAAQGRTTEAQAVRQRLSEVWRFADPELRAARPWAGS